MSDDRIEGFRDLSAQEQTGRRAEVSVYLEQDRLRLVREALAEREVLLSAAPHIIRQLRFVLPHDKAQRPAWLLRLGCFRPDLRRV